MSIEIMSQVWRHARTTEPRELLALLALADWSDEWGGSYPSYATLAEKIKVKKRQTAIDVVSRLVEQGEIYKCSLKGSIKSNLFVVLTGADGKDAIKKRIAGAIAAKGGHAPKNLDAQVEAILKTLDPVPTSPVAGTSEPVASPAAGTSHSPVAGTSLVPASVPNTLIIRQGDTENGGGGIASPVKKDAPPAKARSTAAAVSEAIDPDDFLPADLSVMDALERINAAIRQRRLGRPVQGLDRVAARLLKRGETFETVRAAWHACRNGTNPVGAFVFWTQEDVVPAARTPAAPAATSGPQKRQNPQTGEWEVWSGTGWGPYYGEVSDA